MAAFFAFDAADRQEIELRQVQVPEADQLELLTGNGSPVLGDPDAQVTLVEFGDYQCFFCNKFFHDTEESIIRDYVETGKIKIIFKDYTIIGQDSVNAAHGAHCSDDQGRFWAYHDILYENWTGENNGWASSENLLRFADQTELDIDEWSRCMVERGHEQKILESNEDARSLELTGTPAFFVIGPDKQVTKIGGAQPYEVFQQIFDAELAKL